ncbi:MFS transporter [Phenylobacterium sp. 58.2.17]|uniref:MFS transporter n=1 Tax=Phenylobacterium sp. 58.2.17 TaxID=2969306 RepID=UPI002264E9F6|nr:MFS transporter [Phenylobacterium sp. 58.2.17]MCX7588014.1 MFS transporter [Phenylobacterium sp. 58.2.17]
MQAPAITPRRAVWTLGVTQLIGYGCTSYLPATLAKAQASSLGVSTAFVFGAYSGGLLISALLGPAAGRAVDRHGARRPLALGSLVLTLALIGMAAAQDGVQLALAWLVLGAGMALALYDIAFAGLVGWFGQDARRSITGVTLIAGFASTIAWPLSAWMEGAYGWRATALFWAATNLLIALPLHWTLPRPMEPASAAHAAPGDVDTPEPGAALKMALLATALAVMAGVGSVMAAHLPPLLIGLGASATAAIAAGMLVGPAQVAARLGEFFLVRRIHPLVSARVAVSMFPAGAALLLLLGPLAAAPFAALYGAGNGLFTIVRGTLPLVLFGSRNYGRRLGMLSVPSRLIGAVAPLIFALGMERSPQMSLWVLIIACLGALGCLLVLRKPAA